MSSSCSFLERGAQSASSICLPASKSCFSVAFDAYLERGGLLAIANSGVDTNEECRTCEMRYLCGGTCKAYVRDKHDLNSGDFDCAEIKSGILRMLASQGLKMHERAR